MKCFRNKDEYSNVKKQFLGKYYTSPEALIKVTGAILKKLSKNGFQYFFEECKKKKKKWTCELPVMGTMLKKASVFRR